MKSGFVNYIVGLLIIALFSQCSGDRVPNASAVPSLSHKANPADTFIYTLNPAESNLSGLKKETIREHISILLDTLAPASYISDDLNREDIHRELHEYYALKNYDLVWSSLSSPLPESQLLLSHLLMVDSQGLSVQDYDVSKLLNLQQSVFKDARNINLAQLIMLDIRLSATLISYAWHLQNGRTSPTIRRARWMNERSLAPVAAVLVNHKLTDAIDILTPKLNGYRSMIKALELYRAIAYQGGWPALPEKLNVRLGEEHEAVPQLRKRLLMTQDLSAEELVTCDSLFDFNVQNAVKRFQYRHGLTADGVVGKGTVEALNVPVETRIQQLILNLERIRWMPASFGDRHIFVNIPAYEMQVNEKDKPVLSMRVIVGKKKNATPLFSENLKYVVFSPKWNVPKSIIYKEIVPKLQSGDSTFLKRNNYKLYTRDYDNDQPLNPKNVDWETTDGSNIRIVQEPGGGNALGRVKFLMPNDMNIYMHDTNASYLFSRDARALSHGCVRLESPDLLAEYLLKDQGWDLGKIRKKMYEGEPQWVSLSQEMPVYLSYITSWVDDKGLINFREDIYDIDMEQLTMLKHNSSALAGLF